MRDLPLPLEIALVSNEDEDDVVSRDVLHILKPLFDVLERIAVREVEEKKRACRAAVITACDRAEEFLSGGVPDVETDSLAILGRAALGKNPGGEVVVTVATSKVVEDAVSSAGGRTVYTAVGSPIVARRMQADGGVFGGEENGGLIFADHQFCRDGAMGAARMLECVVRNGALGGQVDDLPQYVTIKSAVACPDEKKEAVVSEVMARHADERLDNTDGLRIDYDDGWVLLRPSGTEPKFRVYSESRDPATAKKRAESFVGEVKTILG